jgi:probable HAF family extracellular repeat protein
MGLSAAFAQTVTTYSVDNLGDLTGFTYPNPHSINNRGQVAGGANTADFSVTHAFRTAPNSPINPLTDDLGLLPGATSASATGINNLGQVSGTATGYSNGSAQAFRADPGSSVLVALGYRSGILSGLADSFANGINDVGQVVGAATVPVPLFCAGFTSHAFRTLPNGPVSTADDLGTLKLDNCLYSIAYAVNASGHVAGWSASFESFQTAFLATPGMPLQDLHSLGGPIGIAYGINDAGQVVGDTDLASNPPYYFYYNGFVVNPGASMQDLGTLGGSYSYAFGINNAAQIVGSSTTPGDTANHAFLYQNGSIYDLNTLVPSGTGWVLESAFAINDFGQIAGTGTLNGVFSAFRLDPTLGAPALPPSGDNCNGTYRGNFNGDITVSSGQTCYFLSGSRIIGNVKVKKGGNLFLRLVKLWGKMALQNGQVSLDQSTVIGNVEDQSGNMTIVDSIFVGNVDITGGGGGGGSVFMDPSQIEGNLTIRNLPVGTAANEICGTKIEGNLEVEGNAAAVMIGQGGACSGNTVHGNTQVQDNTAAMSVIGNTVSGNLRVQDNTAATAVVGNTVSGDLHCSGNASISGSGNTASGDDHGQCAAFTEKGGGDGGGPE